MENRRVLTSVSLAFQWLVTFKKAPLADKQPPPRGLCSRQPGGSFGSLSVKGSLTCGTCQSSARSAAVVEGVRRTSRSGHAASRALGGIWRLLALPVCCGWCLAHSGRPEKLVLNAALLIAARRVLPKQIGSLDGQLGGMCYRKRFFKDVNAVRSLDLWQ